MEYETTNINERVKLYNKFANARYQDFIGFYWCSKNNI